jgi:hypothetical protein
MSEKSVASGGSRGSKVPKASKSSRASKARERVDVPGDVVGIDETSKPSAKMKSVSPAVKAALGDLAADARAMAAIKAAQTEMRLLKEAEAMEAEIAAAQKRSGTLKDAFERSRDPETLLRELAETRAHLDASDAKRHRARPRPRRACGARGRAGKRRAQEAADVARRAP